MPPARTSRPFSRSKNTYRAARITAAVAVAASGAGLLGAAGTAVAQTAAPSSLLEPGSAGHAVTQVQRALHIGTTGRFSSGTRRAVLAFQRRDRLTVDGIVGPQTWDALFHISPQATTAASSQTPADSGASSSSGSGGYSIPSGIVQCESGGNYSAVNSSSGAGGAYQILPSTWQAYGGQGLPQDASPSEQNRIAGEIYARQGPSAWTC